jgi:hypothetical protein
MDAKTIAVILSSLATAPLLVGCTKPPTSEAPQAPQAPATDHHDATAGEHACGNHAEGACGGSAAPDEAPPSSRSFSIAPGKFAEVNFEMAKGATVVVTFEQGGEGIVWDVHSHDSSGGTQIHDRGEGGSGRVEFTAPEAGTFSVLWKNEGSTASPLDVAVSLNEGVGIHSWMPAP